MAVTIRENDVKAANLIFISLAFSLTSILLYPPNTAFRFLYLNALLGFTFLLTVAWAWGIRKGVRWIKVLFCILTPLGILFYIARISTRHDPTGYTLLTLITYVLNVWALIIIFKDLIRKPSADVSAGN